MLAWKEERIRTLGHPVLLRASDRDVDLVRRVARMDEPTARGCLTVLHVDGRPAAMHLGVGDDRSMAGVLVANGPDHRRHSPGSLVALEAVEQAARQGVKTFDCGTGDQQYKFTMATGRRPLTQGLLWRPDLPGTAMLARHGTELALRDLVVRHPRARAAVRKGLIVYAQHRSGTP